MTDNPKEIMQFFALRMSEAFVAGDYAEGNKLLGELMDRQDLTSPLDDFKRGNFAFYAEDPGVTDLNALAFAGIHLGFIVLEMKDHIEETLRTALWETTLPECLIAYDGQYRGIGKGFAGEPCPRWWHANIWFLLIAGRLMMAKALGREDHVEIARERLQIARRMVEWYGLGEYSSPTYYGDQVHGLHFCWYYAPDDEFRADAEALLHEYYLDLAENYHPASGEIAGTWSRHYEQDVEGRRIFARYARAAFGEDEPSYLERFGLEDYNYPASFRDIAYAKETYSVYKRHINDVQRFLYQTPEYSLATQYGRYISWMADVPLLITYDASEAMRRVAMIRNPYWSADIHTAVDYAVDFRRWAHQHENQAILSFGHVGGGNDLLFSLCNLEDFEPTLADAQGNVLEAPRCPLMPAPPDRDPNRPKNPHRPGQSEDLTFMEPAERGPPGLAVEGAVLAELPSCYVALLPDEGLTLRIVIMREQPQVVIPVRPTALVAVVVVGKSECASLDAFAGRVREVTLELGTSPAHAMAAQLSGWGPTLAAGRAEEGRLFDLRVDELPIEKPEYLCYSPFYKRRAGEPLGTGVKNP